MKDFFKKKPQDDSKKSVIVVGGSGFIGRSIQEYVLNQKLGESFVFTYKDDPENIHEKLKKIQIDLLNENSVIKLSHYQKMIYVAGNADHALAKKNPILDINYNVKTILQVLKFFKGSLVMISSQAVYYGLKGKISEDIDHVATIPYGLSKQMAEAYAKYFLQTRNLSKLWIFRLMYAFGEGEKSRRLIPRCAKAFRNKEKIIIFGGGESLINPLPSSFIAEILVRGITDIQQKKERFLEITNLNYPEKISVKDVVRYLDGIRHFHYIINKGGEEWPIYFFGKTENLCNYLKEWGIDFPDLWPSLKKYFLSLIKFN